MGMLWQSEDNLEWQGEFIIDGWWWWRKGILINENATALAWDLLFPTLDPRSHPNPKSWQMGALRSVTAIGQEVMHSKWKSSKLYQSLVISIHLWYRCSFLEAFLFSHFRFMTSDPVEMPKNQYWHDCRKSNGWLGQDALRGVYKGS